MKGRWSVVDGKLVRDVDGGSCPACGKVSCNCSGSPGRALIVRLARQVLLESTQIVVPSETVKLDCIHGAIGVTQGHVVDGVMEECHGLLKIGTLYIDVRVGGGLPDVGWLHDSGEPYQLMQIRLACMSRPAVDDIDMESFIAELRSWVGVYVVRRDVIGSSEADAMRDTDAKSKFRIQGRRVICPARLDGRTVVDTSECRNCYMYLKDGECAGAGMLRHCSDLNRSLEERYDRYCDRLGASVGTVDYMDGRRIGTCSSCGGELQALVGIEGQRIQGLHRTPYGSDEYLRIRCKECGAMRMAECPGCGSTMKMLRNSKNGRVFARCADECGETLTVWDGEPVGMNYADEVIAAGSLDRWLNGEGHEEVESLRKAMRSRGSL